MGAEELGPVGGAHSRLWCLLSRGVCCGDPGLNILPSGPPSPGEFRRCFAPLSPRGPGAPEPQLPGRQASARSQVEAGSTAAEAQIQILLSLGVSRPSQAVQCFWRCCFSIWSFCSCITFKCPSSRVQRCCLSLEDHL